MSSEVAFPSFIKKLACLVDILASPIESPFKPASSINFPAEFPSGFLNKLPADRLFRGWVFFLPSWALMRFFFIYEIFDF